MEKSRDPLYIALYDSSYVILFNDGSWSGQGLSNKLLKKMKQQKSNIEFLTLGPNKQWFFRLRNGQVFYNVLDDDLHDKLENSEVSPYQLWFNDDNGYVIQYTNLNCSWSNVPLGFHHKLNGRRKTLPKVLDLTFGPNDTWWVSFQNGTARWSSNLPWSINKQLNQTKCLVLDPVDSNNYVIFKENDRLEWQVNDDFDNDMNTDDGNDDDDIIYMDPQEIRYTQTSISHQLSNGENISDLRDDLNNNLISVRDIPTINAVRTRSGNIWSLNNRRLWCFRHAHNINRIPVRIVDQRPPWFNNRIQELENPFHIHVRHALESTGFHSNYDSELDSDEY